MNEPKLTILGVYRPQISTETWQEQWQVTEDDQQTREHFDQLVLIEALVEGLSDPFDMGRFGQMHPEFPHDPSRLQVGYDEGLLSSDGETLIQRQMDCVSGTWPLTFRSILAYVRSTSTFAMAIRRSRMSACAGCSCAPDDAYAIQRLQLASR